AKVAQAKTKVPPGGKLSQNANWVLVFHFLWVGTKLAFKTLKHLAKWVVKRVHHDCSYLAKQLVPHHGKTGIFGNLPRLLVRGVVYLVLTLAAYGLPLGFIASLL